MIIKKQRGVGMIEVLVTVLVIAIGLLGLASLQVASVKNTNNAHHRALATILAYDMVERMRSNPAGVKAAEYNGVKVTGKETKCTSCTASQLDTYEWGQALIAGFPSGVTGAVAQSGNNHQITIAWTELTAEGDTPAGNPDFTLNVQIFAP